MADLSLCIGNLATTPYYISGLGVNIYSMEELCFCLSQNAYVLDKDLLDEGLCRFIEKQLKLGDLSAKLLRLVEEEKSIGEFVTTIFEETGYLSEEEIRRVKQVLLDNATLNFAQKRKARGDHLLKIKKYTLAIEEYQFILQKLDKAEDTALYAAILHNIGTAYAYMFLFEKAAYYYREASDLNDNEASRMQYLMALRLTMRKEEYERHILRYGYEEEFLKRVEKKMEESHFIAEHSAYSEAMAHLKELQRDGRITEYYQAIDDTLSGWKQEYRRNMTIRSV